jgi:hypothetical protein
MSFTRAIFAFLANAQQEVARGHFDAAIDHFKNAWMKAQET